MAIYVYDNHMGAPYTTDEPLSYDELYCEVCGDSDQLIGVVETEKEADELIEKYYGGGDE